MRRRFVWLVLSALCAPVSVDADRALSLAHAVRTARAAAATVRPVGRSPALAAIAMLDEVERSHAGGKLAETARLESAALYERLYRVGGDLGDLAEARARLLRSSACEPALKAAALLAESATDLSAAHRELAALAERHPGTSCGREAARAAGLLAYWQTSPSSEVRAPSPSPSPSAEVRAPSPSPSPEVRAPSPSPSPEVRAPSPSPSPSAEVGAPSPSPSAETRAPSPSAEARDPSPAGPASVERVAVWPEGNSTRVAIYVDRPAPYLRTEEDGHLIVRLPGARVARSVPAARTTPVGLLQTVRTSEEAAGARIDLGVQGVFRYRVFPMAEPYRIVVDVARPQVLAPTGPARPLVRRVVLDAGHGGHDSGCQGPRSGVKEKDVTLEVTLTLARLLRERLGLEVVLTRKDDRFVALEERTSMANGASADLFVSIHVNAAPTPQQNGLETFVLARSNVREALEVAARENRTDVRRVDELGAILATLGLSSHQRPSELLARSIQERLVRRLRGRFGDAVQDRGVRRAMFYVLVGAHMPAVLVETSFLTNPIEEARLSTTEYRRELAEGIYEGLAAYIRSPTEPVAPEPVARR